ncbi:MAG: hypothetical protein AB1558_14100 [Thermodesulfobacteriota bacterium]
MMSDLYRAALREKLTDLITKHRLSYLPGEVASHRMNRESGD